MALAAIEVQVQRLAVLAGQVTANTQGQRLARAGTHVAIGVAAKTLADISDDLQLTVVVLGEIQVFRANAQRDRRADTLACTVDRQADARSGVQFHLATALSTRLSLPLRKPIFGVPRKPATNRLAGW